MYSGGTTFAFHPWLLPTDGHMLFVSFSDGHIASSSERPAKHTQVLGLSWHAVVTFAFCHPLSTRRSSVSQVMGYICGAKDSFIRNNFFECVPHLKQSLENKRKRKLVKEAEITQRSQ